MHLNTCENGTPLLGLSGTGIFFTGTDSLRSEHRWVKTYSIHIVIFTSKQQGKYQMFHFKESADVHDTACYTKCFYREIKALHPAGKMLQRVGYGWKMDDQQSPTADQQG